MTAGIPIPVHVVGMETSVAMLMRIESALKGLGHGATESAPKVQELGSTLDRLGERARHVNEIREALVAFVATLSQAVESVADLASEQQRLDANSTRLNLNFRQAAEGAGGFVSEMQTMQLATSLANRGINATQNELNALARVGMARAVDAGKNVEEVFDSIADSVVEGGEELEKFGGSLHRVSDSTHSASERMEALAARGREVAAPMRTAADEVHRLEDEFSRMRRTLAASFAVEFARLSSLPTDMRNAADEGARFNRELTEMAQTAARAVFAVGNGLGVIFGGIGVALGAMIGGVSALAAGLDNVSQRIRAGARGQAGIQSPGAAMRAAWNEWAGPNSWAMRSGQFMERSMDRLTAQDDDSRGGRRGQGAPTAPAADPNDFVFTSEETLGIQRAEDERRNRRGGGGGGGGATASDAELARIEAGIAMAERQSPSERAARHGTTYDAIDGIVLRTNDILRRLQAQRIALLRQQAEEHRSGEGSAERRRRVAGLRGRIDELSRQMDTDDRARATAGVREFATQQGPARERYAELSRGAQDRARESLDKDRANETERMERDRDRSPDAARADLEKERGNRREARALEQRRDNLRNFTDFMEEQYTRQVNIAREGSEMVVFSLRTMGSAYAENLVAWADGSKTFEEAAHSMLSTVLSSLAKESVAKSAFNIAEGFFALATYRYDAAAMHFAAAAGYGILAGTAGFAAGALKDSAPKRDEGKSATASAGRASPQSGATSSAGKGPTVINVAFNGPQFGTGGVVQAARQLVGVINAGAVQGGVQMNRLAIPAGVR